MYDNVEIISFDLFDTLLLRRGRSEIGRYRKVSKHLAKRLDLDWKIIFETRLKAWRYAYSQLEYSGNEASWTMICEFMQTHLNLSFSDVRILTSLEIDEEKKALKLNRKLLRIVKSEFKKGKPLIIISDMYLENQHLQSLIEHFSIERYFQKLYVSSSENTSKSSGSSFVQAIKTYNIEPKQWLHFGDNYQSDYQVPLSFGMQAQHHPRRLRSAYEKYGRILWELRLDLRKI
jgi:predicted HAD superfamily hydrolase